MTAMPPEPDFHPQASAGLTPPPSSWPQPMYPPPPPPSARDLAGPGRAGIRGLKGLRTVTATASARSTGRIRSYRADQIVDYTATPLLQAVAGQQFDVVLNLVPANPEEIAHLVADDGTFVSTTTPGPEDAGRGVRTVRVFVRSDAAQLAGLVARVDAGDLRIEVAERRPLTDLADVHDQAAAGRLPGKTILTP